MKKKKDPSPLLLVAVVGSLGMEAILLTIGGAWFGGKLDQLWQTKPIFVMLGTFAGLGISFLSTALALKAYQKKD